jgi:hypothetical protein
MRCYARLSPTVLGDVVAWESEQFIPPDPYMHGYNDRGRGLMRSGLLLGFGRKGGGEWGETKADWLTTLLGRWHRAFGVPI